MSNVKEIITDVEKLGDWSIEINTKTENKLVQEIVLSLKETMRKNNLESLSAPQIGYERRIFCIRFGKNDYRTFINPAIENNSNLMMSRATCSSIPGKEFILPRNAEVAVMYQTPTGKVQSNKFKGKASFVLQAAVQTLDGLYISDVGLPILDGWDELDESDKDVIISDYLTSLDIKKKEIDTEIKNDEELSKTMDAINFIESIQSGNTELE